MSSMSSWSGRLEIVGSAVNDSEMRILLDVPEEEDSRAVLAELVRRANEYDGMESRIAELEKKNIRQEIEWTDAHDRVDSLVALNKRMLAKLRQFRPHDHHACADCGDNGCDHDCELAALLRDCEDNHE